MALLCLSSSVYSVQTAAEMNERTEFFSAVNANEREALDALSVHLDMKELSLVMNRVVFFPVTNFNLLP